MSFEKPAVVIDNGSYNIKAGFSCDNHPVSIFRTVVGRPNYLKGSYGKEDYEVFIGDDAVSKIEDLELNNPVVKGRIIHWDNMERIWHHCFYKELKVAPEDRPVILACSSNTPIEEKIKCCEVFFETLNCPGICVQPQSVLSLYGSGLTTGLSIDLGYDSTDINPVYEGGLIRYAHMQTNLPSQKVTNFIKQKFAERNYDFGLQTNEIIEDMKKHLYLTKEAICLNKQLNYQQKYKLPSGEEIDVSDEMFMGAEILFQPDLVYDCKSDCIPLHKAVEISASKCDPELRSMMYEAIVPWGGMSVIKGLNTRLQYEIERLIHRPCNVLFTPEPYTVAWLGGATFAGLPDAKKTWITKKQFEDYGAKIVRNKYCF